MNKLTPNQRNLLNFSGGPGALPESVLSQVQQSIHAVPGVGLSILGISHRSKWFTEIVLDTEERIKRLLSLPNDYHVLFLQGGATQQFSTISAAFNSNPGHPAEYLDTGYWSAKSIEGALPTLGFNSAYSHKLRVVWSGKDQKYTQLPRNDELVLDPQASYFHYISNETVEGLQFKELMGLPQVPRICDMSSDFLSAPIQAHKYALIYAHAQKNLGPAGVTVVVIKDSLMKRMPKEFPAFLDYRVHAKAHSNFNTPPVFAIFVVNLITKWLEEEIGGLVNMQKINQQKACTLYEQIDQSQGFFKSSVNLSNRSLMNISFNLQSPELEARFLELASKEGFSGLSGHRSIGGIRASLYNGVTLEATQKLGRFMEQFKNAT